jgi:C-terminal processing protease CtpA/Prc
MVATARSRLEDASARRQPFRRWSVSSPTYQGEASSPFSGTLVVLVDSACGSSCESFVMYARQVPGTLIVGENTAGVGVYGDVRPFHLAASRIWMLAGTKWFHDSPGARVPPEGSGYMPDIWIDSEDASKEAEAIALCLTRHPCGPALRHAIEMQKSPAAPAGR